MSRSNSAYKAHKREQHLKWITDFLDDHELRYEFLGPGNWHLRVERCFDIYPTRNRYHYLKSGERGSFRDYEHLGEVILELIVMETA